MKGGVGKTTLAVNLAWHFFQMENKKVLIVDLDPQFNATQYVMDFSDFEAHRKTKGTIADLLIDSPRLDLRLKRIKKDPSLAIHNLQVNGVSRLDILPSELALGWVVKNPAQMDYRLEKLLSSFRSKYDYIIVDCAPTDSVLTTMALTSSNYLLVPVRPDRFSVLGFANLNRTIEDFRQNCNNPHNVQTLGIVFTQVTGNSVVESECITQIKLQAAKHKEYVFVSSLKYSNSFARAIKNQTPIFKTAYAQQDTKNATHAIASELKGRVASLPMI